MNHSIKIEKCSCNTLPQIKAEKQFSTTKLTARSMLSTLLSIVVAFFPKCAFCWAAYMSMFGCVGLAKLPYMPWLLPVLLLLLCIHLLILYSKASYIGYFPFVISLFGAVIIIFARTYLPYEKWLLILGMLSIVSGSLLNSFPGSRNKLKPQIHQITI